MGKQTKVGVIGGGIAGVAAAWALHRSGYEVDLFEKGSELGGNARTFRWELDGSHAESPLLVIAWPERYYHNYRHLLDKLGLDTATLPISYFVHSPEGVFCQDGRGGLDRRFAVELTRWKRLVAFITRVNDFFLRRDGDDSLYHFSYLNPMNLIPLFWLVRLFGVSKQFWDTIFVPVHCATFISTSLRGLPAVIAPLLESVVPLDKPCEMGTWRGPPRQVFEKMTEAFRSRVHTSHEIARVARDTHGFLIEDSKGRRYEADKVVFACDSKAALRSLESPTALQRAVLGGVRYVDDDDPTFSKFVVHSDTTIFPEAYRDRIAREFNTYSELDAAGNLECTFVLSSQYPGLKGLDVPMLVTFNSQKSIDQVKARVDLPRPTHSLCLSNLIRMSMMRFLQGRHDIYYCGAFTTPEGGHDLSLLSGFVAAEAIGARYPLPTDHALAVADFRRMRRLMLGR